MLVSSSRPLHRVLISQLIDLNNRISEIGSRPLHGVLISQYENFLSRKETNVCSRPLHGVLISLFQKIRIISLQQIMFSSPPRGSYISMMYYNIVERQQASSRPLHGVLLSQSCLQILPQVLLQAFSSPPRGSLISMKIMLFNKPSDMTVLVPSTGFSYLNKLKNAVSVQLLRSRPLHGVLLSQSAYNRLPSTLLNCSRPLHGVLLSQQDYYV